MPITAKNSGEPRELVPAGNHVAVCYQMIEIGTVQESYMGKPVIHKKVRIGWELSNEMRVFDESKGAQPMVISREFTLSMNEKANLRKMLESWRGSGFTDAQAKSFQVDKLLGKPCMLNIIHATKQDGSGVYAKIAGVTPIPKGMNNPKQHNSHILLCYDNFDDDLYETMPDFIKEKMASSKEFKELFEDDSPTIEDPESPEHLGPDDDLPF